MLGVRDPELDQTELGAGAPEDPGQISWWAPDQKVICIPASRAAVSLSVHATPVAGFVVNCSRYVT